MKSRRLVLLAMISSFRLSSGEVPDGTYQLGIFRSGPATPAEQKAYPKLERRLQRGLENLPGSSTLEIFSFEARPDLQGRLSLLKLGARAEQILKAGDSLSALKPSQLSPRIYELDQMLGLAEREPASGPVRQRALLAEASLWNILGDESRCRSRLTAALRLHPRGLLPADLEWEWESSLNSQSGLSTTIAEAIAQIPKTSCRVSVPDLPADASITVNGFETETETASVKLLTGVRYEIGIRRPGHATRFESVRCANAETRTLKMESSSGAEDDRPALPTTFIDVVPDGGRFELFLYTPGRFLDPIPCSSAPSVAELSLGTATDRLPIDTDTFLALLRKHQKTIVPLAHFPAESESVPGRATAIEKERNDPPAETSRWYNKKSFWIFLGGAALGAVVLYNLSDREAPDQKGLSVELH